MIDNTLYDAFGQRQIAQYFTQLEQLYVILEMLPSLQGDLARSTRSNRIAAERAAGAALGLRQMDDGAGRSRSSINHQGQFPAVTISLQPGARRRARPGRRPRSTGPHAEMRRAGDHRDEVPGHGAGLPAVAVNRAVLILARAGRGLHHPRHPLRKLHPPADHPLHFALRRASARC